MRVLWGVFYYVFCVVWVGEEFRELRIGGGRWGVVRGFVCVVL